jgi:hypothetical protein
MDSSCSALRDREGMSTGDLRPPAQHTKDFWAGLLYIAFGAAAVLIGRDYTFGTASRMGAGFFPTVLGGLLIVIGILSVLRAYLRHGDRVGAFAWRPLVTIGLATILFAPLLPAAGLPITLLALGLLVATASQSFRIEVRATLGLVLLVGLCTLVFVRGLNVPLPVLGYWFGD